MTRKIAFVVLGVSAVAAFSGGCSADADAHYTNKTEPIHAERAASSSAGTADSTIQRATIRTANLGIEVRNAEECESKVESLVKGWDGYVESTRTSDLSGGVPRVEMSIRVPFDKFGEAIAQLQTLGIRRFKETSGRDVTAQLATMKAAQRLGGDRSLADSFGNDYAQLSEEALMPRISLEMWQSGPGVVGTDPDWFASAWTNTSTLFGTIVRGLVTAVLYTLVTAPIWLPIVLIFRWLIRRGERLAAPKA
jgi:hypothetical protein